MVCHAVAQNVMTSEIISLKVIFKSFQISAIYIYNQNSADPDQTAMINIYRACHFFVTLLNGKTTLFGFFSPRVYLNLGPWSGK